MILECLRVLIGHVIPDEGRLQVFHRYCEQGCIISDWHAGIKSAIAMWRKGDDGRLWEFHRYCLQHVASNFNTQF